MLKWWFLVSLGSMLALGLFFSLPTPDASAQSDATRSTAAKVERGRYLVNDVAQCVQCHSPRSASGEIARTKLMQGAPIEMQGPPWIGDLWASHAPNAITFARGRADYVITLLTTGARPDGTVPKSPMPQYAMSIDDAEAVVSYLRSLK